MFEFINKIFYCVRSYFKRKEKERAETKYIYIANRLYQLKTIRDKLLPITYQNATAHKIIIEETEDLITNAKQLKKHGLYSNFKLQEESMQEKINETKKQISFAECNRPINLPKAFNHIFTRY